MNRFYTLFLLQVAFSLLTFPAYALERYQCYFNKDKSFSTFDKFVTISDTESGRVIYTDYFGDVDLKTVEKKDHFLISIYETTRYREDQRHFKIFQFNTLNNELDIGNGYHMTIRAFEKGYLIPYNQKNFRSINRNPEFLPYLPEKKDPNFISHTFIKSKYYCKPISAVTYHTKKIIHIFLSF